MEDDFGIKVIGRNERIGFSSPEKKIYKFNGEELTEWDLKFLYTRGEMLNADQIAFLFNTDNETVFKYMWYYGVRRGTDDNQLHRDILRSKAEQKIREKEQKINREVAKRMKADPKPERVYIGRKAYINVVFPKATHDEIVSDVKADILREEEAQRKDRYTNKWFNDMSNLTSTELRAIRLYRGLDRIAFAGIAKVSPSFIRLYEIERHTVITKMVEDIYIQTLNIRPKELKKIRDTLAGKRTLEEEEDREIPPFIKKEVWTRDQGKCTGCGMDKHIHYHHIKKFSDGGMHRTDNLKLLCVACHAKAHRSDQSFHMLKKLAFDLLGVLV